MTETLLYAATVGFEAAREVSLLPDGHRSRRLHGHSFLAEVRCSLPIGWADFPGNEVPQLRDRLSATVQPLDYDFLNRKLEQPTDENLARWVRQHLDVPGIDNVAVQSTSNEGVDIDRNDHAHVWRRYLFESAHQLPNVPVGHKCGRMHGHGFEVILHANQDISSREMSLDYDYLDACWQPIHQELHMACLNDLAGLENPTSEIISAWIWNRLKPTLPELSWVTVYETASAGAHFDGTNYRIWKEQTFDSALRLVRAPDSHPTRRLHGHTYITRLHLSAPLNRVMGWTVDYGDVKELFKPIFERLDHQPLHELPGVVDTDTASLARWIRHQTEDKLPQLDRIDVFQSRGCGAILSWGPLGPALPI
jgi:6-pyruvoyltetrahydropterin/6-carboxytetrahydropterin synthase